MLRSVFAVITLLTVAAAQAATTNLYDYLGAGYYFGTIGDADFPDPASTTGQRFNASDPALASALPVTALIDRVGLRIAIDPNKTTDPEQPGYLGAPARFQFMIRLWTWNTDLATTIAQTPIADSGVLDWAGGFDGWVQLNCPPQPASGTYFVGITRMALAINGQWRVGRSPGNSTAPESVCYRAGAATNSRELQLQLHWYDAGCASAPVTAVNAISGNVVLTGAARTMTLAGTNLDGLTAATLTRRHAMGGSSPVIHGTLQPAATAMTSRQVTFDLTGAEGGYYDLGLACACDRVANAYDGTVNDSGLLRLKNAVLVYLPHLENPSFEIAWNGDMTGGYCSVPRGLDLVDAKHWSLSVDMGGVSGSQWRRDGAVYVPGCTGTTPAGGDGLHYASMVANTTWPLRNTAFQAIAAPHVVGQTTDQGTTFRLAYHLAQATEQITLRLVDGPPGGPTIAEAILPYTAHAPLEEGPAVTLEPGYVFQSSPPLLTIEIQADQDAGTAPHALHFDQLRAIPGCNLPWADSDHDGDVDATDFGMFQRCWSPVLALPSEPAYCNCFDQVKDGHINDHDFAVFARCASGPSVEWVQCDP